MYSLGNHIFSAVPSIKYLDLGLDITITKELSWSEQTLMTLNPSDDKCIDFLKR